MASPIAWLAADLDATDPSLGEQWTAELHRCAQALGWTLSPWSATSAMTALRARELVAPYGTRRIELRAHGWLPILAFVEGKEHRPATKLGDPWDPEPRPYLNPPELVAWWQARGWLVPDAAWLGGLPDPDDLAALSPRESNFLRRLGWNRGEALLLPW
ncbi:hypothetical protein GO986_20295 [Deinococcus sp. HMF7620]|uniref:Uncharacterized protein n=1 Tax=Deinococcus arboris TaxID=2682977 RepID=A0A7C9M914_9DEIO|nr:hypothetical protein [Deinococcus arboris]MVN89085.1 hypothetical protein [Deinococcus arboris]